MTYCRSEAHQRRPHMPLLGRALPVLVGFVGWVGVCLAQTADGLSPFSPLLQVVFWLTGVVILAAPVAWMRRVQRHNLLGSQHTLQSLRALPSRDFQWLVGDGFRRQGYAVKFAATAGRAFDMVLSKAGRRILVRCSRGNA